MQTAGWESLPVRISGGVWAVRTELIFSAGVLHFLPYCGEVKCKQCRGSAWDGTGVKDTRPRLRSQAAPEQGVGGGWAGDTGAMSAVCPRLELPVPACIGRSAG